MMKTRMILFFMLLMAVTFTVGCLPSLSLNPYYTDKDVTFDEDILGFWLTEDHNTTWLFTKDGVDKYSVKLSSDDGVMFFTAHLFELEDTLYLDLYPDDEFYNFLMVGAHTIVRVKKTGDEINLSYIERDWLTEYLKDNPDATSHAWRINEDPSDNVAGLTGSTEDLQDFIIKIRNVKGAFDTNYQLYRKSRK